jgi:hypothetical protein
MIPSCRGAAVELRTSAHVHRDLPLILVSKSQFPDNLPDGAGGVLTRPAACVLAQREMEKRRSPLV